MSEIVYSQPNQPTAAEKEKSSARDRELQQLPHIQQPIRKTQIQLDAIGIPLLLTPRKILKE